MRIDIITIFPELFDSFLSQSLIHKAIQKKLLKIKVHDLRKYTKDKHKKVDDKPFGGGAGMVMTCQPWFDAIKKIKQKNKGPVIYLSPQGDLLKHQLAQKMAVQKDLILICGRYEGIDQRVIDQLVDQEISIGEYVLNGGELAAMVVVETIARFIPGFLGKEESHAEDSFSENLHGKKEYPQYTRPAVYKKLKVPAELLSGDHALIKKWREEHLKD